MKKRIVGAACLCALAAFAGAACADGTKGEKVDGKKEFEEHCAQCHANGGNIMNRSKTLSQKDLKANGVKNAKDIVAKMRKPGPGMTMFDKKSISDNEAKAIADYILKTYK